jgi:hypothetical protein
VQNDKLTEYYNNQRRAIEDTTEAQKAALEQETLSAEEMARRLKEIDEKSAEDQAALDEELARKRAITSYRAASTEWGFTLTGAIADAIAATVKMSKFGPVAAGLTATANALRVASILAQKPNRPSFAVGTAQVPTDMVANIHKNEGIIPAPFMDSILNGELTLGGPGGGGSAIEIDGDVLGRWIEKAQDDGRLRTARASIV